ncbi:MAG: hypothetical protein ACLFVX_04045 [Archaeoglobaceae archaeon]
MRDRQDEHIGLTREMRGDFKAIREKQDEHIKVTKSHLDNCRDFRQHYEIE